MYKTNFSKWSISLSVDFPFPVNKIRRNVNHVQDVVDAFIPPFEQESLVLNGPEINSIINSINPARDQFQVVQFAEFLFWECLIDSDELAHSGQGHSAVVLGNDSEVVLDKHAVKLFAVGLG